MIRANNSPDDVPLTKGDASVSRTITLIAATLVVAVTLPVLHPPRFMTHARGCPKLPKDARAVASYPILAIFLGNALTATLAKEEEDGALR
jgi:hypothetical protein